MKEKRCEKCGRIIVEDFERYLEENPEQRWIQCPYCLEMEELNAD